MNEYIMKYLGALVGAKILTVLCDDEVTGEEFYGFRVLKKDGTQANIWFLSDEEGNAPGFLDIVEHKKPIPEAIKKYLDMNPEDRKDLNNKLLK